MNRRASIFVTMLTVLALCPETMSSCDPCKDLALADLIISAITSPDYPNNSTIEIDTGTILSFESLISNKKDHCDTRTAVESSMKLLVKWFGTNKSGQADTLYSTSALAQNQSSTVTSGVQFLVPGEYELEHYADALNVVAERNENNNVAIVFQVLNWVLEVLGGRTTEHHAVFRLRVVDKNMTEAKRAHYDELIKRERFVKFF